MSDELILDILYKNRKDYKGTMIMRNLLKTSNKFKKIIIDGIKSNEIYGWSDDLWEKIENQNIRGISSFLDVFKEGTNLGYCTVAAKQVSYSFDDSCEIAGGTVEYLIGTNNSPDGSHTWIVYNNMIYDTTFMIVMSKAVSKELKYCQESIYNPNIDPIYVATKEFTNDKNLKM